MSAALSQSWYVIVMPFPPQPRVAVRIYIYIMCPLSPHIVIMRQGRGSEAFFADRQRSLFIPGCVQGAIIYLINWSVCLSVSVCVTFVFFPYCESCTRPISTNPGSMEASKYELTWDMFRRALSRGGGGRWAAVDFVVCFGSGVFFLFCVVLFFSFLRTHTACCKYEAALPRLPIY